MTIRTILVDDEKLAIQGLQLRLEPFEDVEIIDTCSNGREAIRKIKTEKPDLVFLDIQMPKLDGFGVLEEVGLERMPEVVFVTAYDTYALDAFAVSALDFLLKPFADERFEATLDRALDRLEERRAAELGERLSCLIDGRRLALGHPVAEAPKPLRRLSIEKRGRIYFVPVADIHWIESDGPYVRLHTADGHHLKRDSLKRLEKALDPEIFVRIHRSTMVHVDRVAELQPLFHGEYRVTLTDGAELKLSRSYRDRLPLLLEG
ncbi:MAG: LytTR family DNA-binding domain-containing protein [Acidobacteriota bacterium]